MNISPSVLTSFVVLAEPVTLDLRIPIGPRPRVVPPGQLVVEPEHIPQLNNFEKFPLTVVIDGHKRVIYGILSPIPRHLDLYGPEDFAAAASDTIDDHVERVLTILGDKQQEILQALVNGDELPELPKRVPREIPNWRAKVVLATMGLLPAVESVINGLPEPEKTVVTLAWNSDAKLARKGKTVTQLASILQLSDQQLDELFIAAEAIEL